MWVGFGRFFHTHERAMAFELFIAVSYINGEMLVDIIIDTPSKILIRFTVRILS